MAPDRVALIAQDHLNLQSQMHNPAVCSMPDAVMSKVDAFVTLTEAD